MDSGASPAAGLLTPPDRSARAGARTSASRSGSRARRDGAAGASKARGASPRRATSPAGSVDGGGGQGISTTVRSVRTEKRKKARDRIRLGLAAKRPQAGARADDEAVAHTEAERMPNDRAGDRGGAPEGPKSGKRPPATRPPGGQKAARRGGSPNPRHVDKEVSVEEIAIERTRPVASTLSISPIRWRQTPGAEDDQRSPSRSAAPWKKENRPGAGKAGDKGRGKGLKGKPKGKKGKGKGKKAGKAKKEEAA